MKKHLIIDISKGSIAEELGIRRGDVLVSVNGKNIADVFDYRMEICSGQIEIHTISGSGSTIYEIDKDPDEDIGLVFEDQLMDKPRRCVNKCVFCFIDQLPPGMRETLYFKDDDIRLSFLHGNYVTMSNIGRAELERIIRHRLSPINISVHATEPELRKRMLGNKKAGNIIEMIRLLLDERIEVNAQFVIVPGVNDGDALKRSLDDMCEAGRINSISVVPVGITKFREDLPLIKQVDSEAASRLIRQTEAHRGIYFKKYGKGTVYAADELYIKAGIEIPPVSYYEGYPQIENGVGMVRSFIDDFEKSRAGFAGRQVNGRFSLITGENFYEHLAPLADLIDHNGKIRIHKIRNDFFGDTVGTAGLLTYTDIVRQLEDEAVEENVILPSVLFRNPDMLTLDGYSVDDLGRALGRKIIVVQNDAAELLRTLFGMQDGE